MSQTIHTVLGNFRSNSIQIAADIAGVELKTNFIQWKDLKSKENLARNPQGQIPTLETSEGNISQTAAILTYIAGQSKEVKLLGANDFERAQVDQWIDFANYELLRTCVPLLLQVWGFRESTPEQLKEALKQTETLLEYLNNNLKSQEYFVKSGLSAADILIHSIVVYLFRCVLSQEHRNRFPNLTAWFENVSSNASVQKYFGVNRYSQPWF